MRRATSWRTMLSACPRSGWRTTSCCCWPWPRSWSATPIHKKILAELLRKDRRQQPRWDLSAVGHAVSYKGMGHYRQKAGILNPLLDAILNRHPVEILHQEVFGPVREPSWRKVTPLHLLFYRANWYLLALCWQGMAHFFPGAHRGGEGAAGRDRAKGQPEGHP